uniref:Uncharacterized protein n=1 Tax=Gopherus evgoodei TaxID=1825980 RepID=A0A8C4WQB4_9SAUR
VEQTDDVLITLSYFLKSSLDAEDINCGSLQENCLLASCAWQEESLYNPRCHHAAPLSLSSPNRMPEVGQFDDADD